MFSVEADHRMELNLIANKLRQHPPGNTVIRTEAEITTDELLVDLASPMTEREPDEIRVRKSLTHDSTVDAHLGVEA